MHNILLIPGYGGTEGDFARGEKGRCMQYINQKAFEEHGNTTIYAWPLATPQPSPLNVPACARLYITQARIATEPATWAHLRSMIEKTQPDTIICHSLGARLFLNMYAENPTLPTSVHTIFLAQGDVSRHKTVAIAPHHHFFCGHSLKDELLWLSALVNFRLPMGLFGWSGGHNETVHNVPMHLHGMPIISLTHVSPTRDKEVIDAMFATVEKARA
jgi:hypothetical protein